MDYVAGEAGLSAKGFVLTGGYELLGSDKGHALQTPMATLHKFNGWADLFLTTPSAGLEDVYVGLNASSVHFSGFQGTLTWHSFHSDSGDVHFGEEWDASVGVKVSRVALLANFADYRARSFGVDTRKFWLQAEYAF